MKDIGYFYRNRNKKNMEDIGYFYNNRNKKNMKDIVFFYRNRNKKIMKDKYIILDLNMQFYNFFKRNNFFY
jgi:hypothetical protein